jgi:nucleoside-diphosphate-sugar epimerase
MIDQNVFKAAVELGIPHFFYASSSHLYPSSRQQSPDAAPLRESEALPAAPELTYGWGKLLGEITLLGLAKENPDFHVSIARIMGAYGYNQDYDLETGSVIPVFCHRAIRWPEGAPFGIWGSGNETRSYCFIDDIVDAIIKSVAVQDKLQVVGPFNLAAEGRIKISEIADTVIKISGKDIQPQYDITAKTVLWGQSADCSLTRNLLGGWTPKTIFEEGIKKTYRHIERRICG